MNFEDQTSKNVHDVWKVFLETTFGVLAYFSDFLVFVLDNIDVGGPKILYKHIRVEDVFVKVPKDQQRVLQEGPFSRAKTVQNTPKRWRQ